MNRNSIKRKDSKKDSNDITELLSKNGLLMIVKQKISFSKSYFLETIKRRRNVRFNKDRENIGNIK